MSTLSICPLMQCSSDMTAILSRVTRSSWFCDSTSCSVNSFLCQQFNLIHSLAWRLTLHQLTLACTLNTDVPHFVYSNRTCRSRVEINRSLTASFDNIFRKVMYQSNFTPFKWNFRMKLKPTYYLVLFVRART